MGPVLDSLQVQAARVTFKENIVAQVVEARDTLPTSARRRTPDHAPAKGLEQEVVQEQGQRDEGRYLDGSRGGHGGVWRTRHR